MRFAGTIGARNTPPAALRTVMSGQAIIALLSTKSIIASMTMPALQDRPRTGATSSTGGFVLASCSRSLANAPAAAISACRFRGWGTRSSARIANRLRRCIPVASTSRSIGICLSPGSTSVAHGSRLGSRYSVQTSSGSCSNPSSTSSSRFDPLPTCAVSAGSYRTTRRCSSPTVCRSHGHPSGPALLASG